MAAILFTVPVSAQQLLNAEGGEIKNLQIERNRATGEVTVTMDIDVTDIAVGRDATLILTPIVTDDIQKVTMPSIELMGRRANIYYNRDGQVSETENPYTAQRIIKRSDKKDGERQVINYTHTFAFEEWMRGEKVALRTGLCGCGKLRYEDDENVGNFGHTIYDPEYVWSFIEPEVEHIKVRDESHSAYINFYVDKYNIVEHYKNNTKELAGIIESITKVQDDEDLTITSITIEGWASPEATEQHNKTLSQNRANSLADYVTKHTGIERSRIEAIGCGEDWPGLRREVEATPGLYRQADVLEIIDDETLTQDQKNAKFEAMEPSTIYKRLLNELYPRLRRNDYRIVYNVRHFDLEEARVLVDTDPRKLSVYEIYIVAGSYEKGSKEYNHVLEVAAKQYPEVVAAAVNAANLEIEKGDYAAALEILERSNQDDARILAAEGYVYLKQEAYDKARLALTKAADMGNEDAKHNLAEMEAHLSSI